MNDVHVIGPVLKQLIRLEGWSGERRVHNTQFCWLMFSYNDWSMGPKGYTNLQVAYDIPAAVVGMGTRSIGIEKCVLANLGGYAEEFGGGLRQWRGIREEPRNDGITGNGMYDLGAGGFIPTRTAAMSSSRTTSFTGPKMGASTKITGRMILSGTVSLHTGKKPGWGARTKDRI